MNTEPTQKATVTVGATGKKVGEGNLEKTVVFQCGQLTIGSADGAVAPPLNRNVEKRLGVLRLARPEQGRRAQHERKMLNDY